MEDENSLQFRIYLLVQLDVTCHGFQYMVLFNGKIIFSQLNLVKKSKDPDVPGDFYIFLLHKVIYVFYT